MSKIDKALEDRIQKTLLELQCVLRLNTREYAEDNAYVVLTAAIQLYTLVSKNLVDTRENFLYNSALAWDNIKNEDMIAVTYQ